MFSAVKPLGCLNYSHVLVDTDQLNPGEHVQSLTFTVRWATNKYKSKGVPQKECV